MAFTENADGSLTYDGNDEQTPHALVVTEAFTGQLRFGAGGGGDGPLVTPVLKGTVMKTKMLGSSNVAAGQGPRHPKAVLIAHATAKENDILPDDEVTPMIATMAKRKAAWEKFVAAERAKPPAPPSITVGKATLTEEDLLALKAMVVAKPAT